MIKKLNPLIILSILILSAIILVVATKIQRQNLKQENINFYEFNSQAKSINALKSAFKANQAAKKLSDFVMKNNLEAKSEIVEQNSNVILKLNNLTNIDSIVKQLLNSSFEIQKIQIEKHDKIDLFFEVSK